MPWSSLRLLPWDSVGRRCDGAPGPGARGLPRRMQGAALWAGVLLLGVLWGCLIAAAGPAAAYLCASGLGAAFILRDFRVGVVLLILLMPIAGSHVFPHTMLGVTGLNPVNLLLAATLGACLLQAAAQGGLRGFLPRPLWFYLLPILVAGAIGAHRVGDIAPAFYMLDMLDFHDAAGYLRDLVVKPLSLVVFALLVCAAAARSARPEKFLLPALLSVLAMDAIVVVYVAQSGVALYRLASSESREFLSALGMHANDLGRLYAVAYALLLFAWGAEEQPALRVALLAAMGLTAIALMLTFSRGAFVAFALVNALFVLRQRGGRALLFAAALAGLALFALPDAVRERATVGFGGGLDAISAGRLDGLWLPLLPEVLRSPVYGSGIESILWSDPMRVGGGANVLLVTHPHNAYLRALLDTGVLGLALLGAYYAHAWRRLRECAADPACAPTLRGFFRGAAAALVAILVADFTDSSLMPRPEQVFLWFAIGMMYGRLAAVARVAGRRR